MNAEPPEDASRTQHEATVSRHTVLMPPADLLAKYEAAAYRRGLLRAAEIAQSEVDPSAEGVWDFTERRERLAHNNACASIACAITREADTPTTGREP